MLNVSGVVTLRPIDSSFQHYIDASFLNFCGFKLHHNKGMRKNYG